MKNCSDFWYVHVIRHKNFKSHFSANLLQKNKGITWYWLLRDNAFRIIFSQNKTLQEHNACIILNFFLINKQWVKSINEMLYLLQNCILRSSNKEKQVKERIQVNYDQIQEIILHSNINKHLVENSAMFHKDYFRKQIIPLFR